MSRFSLCLSLFLLAVSGAGAQAPARVDCSVSDNGKPASGGFRVVDGDREVARGSCGKPAALPAGSYEVVLSLDGAADAPVKRERLEAKAGETASVRGQFETGELLIEVTRGGRRSIAIVRLFKGASALATLTAGVASRVSTGTYSVEVESRGELKKFDAVSIGSSQRRVIAVDFGA